MNNAERIPLRVWSLGPASLVLARDALVLECPTLLMAPWVMPREEIREVAWWNQTGVAFRSVLHGDGGEPATRDMLTVGKRWPPTIAVYLGQPSAPLQRRMALVRGPLRAHRHRRLRPLPGRFGPSSGVYMRAEGDRVKHKRALERWGAVFPEAV